MRRYGRPSPTDRRDSNGQARADVRDSQCIAPCIDRTSLAQGGSASDRCRVPQHHWNATRGEDMPIRRGEEYLESLRDGRCVWLMGQRVEDVTTHPALAGCARSVAAVYDLQHDPATRIC